MYEAMSKGEQKVARRLVKAAIKLGYIVSVFDGEEWSPRFRTFDAAWAWMGNTGEDQIRFFDAAGNQVGWMFLAWDNDPDGQDLIADYTANVAMEKLYRAANGQHLQR